MTAAREPTHPDQRVREVTDRVRGIDLSGGASTVGRDRDELTTGAGSLQKAVKGGFTGGPGSPVGPTLLQSYLRWRERETLTKASQPKPRTAAEAEAHAHKKGLRKAGKRLAEGDSRDAAFASGFRKYRKAGGRLGLAAWIKKCAR